MNNILIDPGDEWEGFQNVDIVLLTHAHFDHIYGLNSVCALNPLVNIYTNAQGAKMLQDDKLNLSRYHESSFIFNYPERIRIVNDGTIINSPNGVEIEVYETPGHNPSCLTFLIEDKVFTGDAYIPGTKTVTNLPHSNKEEAEKSVEKILEISRNKTIYPGHFVSDSPIESLNQCQ